MRVEHPIVLFDGSCGLCNHWVDFVLARDRSGTFRFAPLQGEAGLRWLARAELPADYLDSLVLVDEEGIWTHSTAALRIARRLGGGFSLAGSLLLVPRVLRDAVYRLVAHGRQRLVAQRSTCRVPSPEERDRFLV